MRINFLFHELPIRQVGGVLSNLELMKGLIKRGHDCKVIYPKLPLYYQPFSHGFDRVLSQGLRVYRLWRRHFPETMRGNVPAIPIPFIHPSYIPAADLLLVSWWELAHQVKDYPDSKGKKINIIRGHENHIEGLGKRKNLEHLINDSYRLPQFTKIAISPHLKEVVERTSGDHVYGPIPNGINFDEFTCNNQPKLKDGPFRIGMICRHLPVKGFQDGLKAVETLIKRGRKIELFVIGEDPKTDDPRIHYNGYIPRHKLQSWYGSLDLFLWTSREEGFGNPPLEAMACGCPVVSTRTGSMLTHAIDGYTVLLSDPGDIQDLTSNIRKLMNSESLRVQLIENAYRYVKRFTWDHTVEQYEHVFEEVLNA